MALSVPRLTNRLRADRPACANESCQNVGSLERWASAAAGVGLLAFGMRGGMVRRVLTGLTGAALVQRGVTGHCDIYGMLGIQSSDQPHSRIGVPARKGVRFDETVQIACSPEEVYRYWRHLENLPRFMRHLESVRELDERHSRWIARSLLGSTVEWDAEIINERENELIAWRSLPGSEVDTAGSVRFVPADAGHETLLRVEMKYRPIGGKFGIAVASLFGDDAQSMIRDDLARLKQLLEGGTAGEPATLAGGLSARMPR